MDDVHDDRFAAVARAMSVGSTLDLTLDSALAGALDLVEGAEQAGVSLVRRRRQVETVAASGDLVRPADRLQLELGEGPCLQALTQTEAVHAADLRAEDRWPRWSARAADELGLRSMLCVQLFVTDDALGALNLFSTVPDAFDDEDVDVAMGLAVHVAVAVAAARQIDNLETAVLSRTVIGQAGGMLMERFQMSGDQAYNVLKRISQAQNKKLRQVALDIVTHGIRPELFEG